MTANTTNQEKPMSHKAKFKEDDLVVNECGETAVVRFAEPDDHGCIIVNAAENPDSEKDWRWVYQGLWTRARQIPERWLVSDCEGVVLCDSLEAARDYATEFWADAILHIRKDGTTEWLDTEEEG